MRRIREEIPIQKKDSKDTEKAHGLVPANLPMCFPIRLPIFVEPPVSLADALFAASCKGCRTAKSGSTRSSSTGSQRALAIVSVEEGLVMFATARTFLYTVSHVGSVGSAMRRGLR